MLLTNIIINSIIKEIYKNAKKYEYYEYEVKQWQVKE